MVEHMHDLGMLTPRLTINHAIWLTRREIDLLGNNGCSFTHTPLSNLKLGSAVLRARAPPPSARAATAPSAPTGRPPATRPISSPPCAPPRSCTRSAHPTTRNG